MTAGLALFLLATLGSAGELDYPTELATLRRVAEEKGEALWPGFGRAPFGFLLVGERSEVLLCHPSTPADFVAEGRDPATGCERFVRPRGSLPRGLLAALPIFGPPSTIVMGTPEATGTSLPRWRATILHEHFHQWQDELPDFYARIAALDLAADDESGMWMLNFPFPYEDETVAAAFAAASRALAAAVSARGSPDFAHRLGDYLERRRAFAQAAGTRNWRYFDFQLWKEGVARWTEVALGRGSGDAAMIAEAALREREILADLERPDLAERKRVAVYAMGAAEAMLLEACSPAWRRSYPAVLGLGPLFEEAEARCADSPEVTAAAGISFRR